MSRILILHWGTSAAGPTLSYEVARHLIAGTDHNISVSYSRGAQIAAKFASLDAPGIAIKTWTGATDIPRTLLMLPKELARLALFLKRQGIETVVVPMEHPLHVAALPILKRLTRRHVLFIHDGTLHPGEDTRLRRLLHRRQVAAADAAITFSSSVRAICQSLPALKGKPILEAHLPATLSEGEDIAPRLAPQGRPVILGMFGRVVEYKGFDIACAAAAELVRRGMNLELHLVGRGMSETIAAITPIHPWMRITDTWVADADIPALLQSFDVLLAPYREASQSGVLSESFAVGVPVVATPVGGLPEQIELSGCGVTSAAVSPEAVADAVEALLAAPTTYEQCSRDGIERSRGILSWDALMSVIQEALNA